MKKIILSIMAVGLLAACDSPQETPTVNKTTQPEVEVKVDAEPKNDATTKAPEVKVEQPKTVVEDAKNKAEQLSKDVKENVEAMTEKGQDAAKDLENKAKDTVDQVSKDIKENVDAMKEQGQDAAKKLEDNAKGALEQTQTNAQDLAKKAEDALDSLTDGKAEDVLKAIGPKGEELTLETCAAFTYDPQNMDAATRAKVEACEALAAAAKD